MNPLFRPQSLAWIAPLGWFLLLSPLTATDAHAQIVAPSTVPVERDRYATLQDQLVNRLRATREDQQAYINHVVEQVRLEKLETSLVIAIERYALRRNRHYPFPFFERALRYEAGKRGLDLPSVQHFASTRANPASGPRP